ncbi:MAG: hypothetical protein CVV41_20095 [Candidatus Riflebacteria bacterium HGW-Riflebacteria-1]|jgi:phosphoglycolate phosphatase-like HAD superfamily hydrolase|nr:MAG: hypothetical protein CVV41_20095 [Candidatus Riflebacteria bacterium HGW-Riflebacteria-1]
MQFAEKNKSVVIFLDLDGPVLEGKHRHYSCYSAIINRYGGQPLDIDAYWDMKRSKIKRDVLLEKSGFQALYSCFLDDWMKLIESPQYLKFDKLKPKAKETLVKWKQSNFKIVLVTMRQNRENLINQLKQLGVFSLLDEIIDCPPLRQNTKFEALKYYNFCKAIFIGDTEEDANTAKMLGIPFIGITNGLRTKELLNADLYFKEICQINLDILENI